MSPKKIFLYLKLIFIFIGLSSNFAYAKLEGSIKKLDRIIAVVDQDVITEKELQEKVNSVISNLKSQKI